MRKAIAGVSILLLGGCSTAPEPPPAPPLVKTAPVQEPLAPGFARIEGSVTDHRHEPIEGAVITICGRTATTDASGRFVLASLPAPSADYLLMDVRIEKPGFGRKTILQNPIYSAQSHALDVELGPEPVTGTVGPPLTDLPGRAAVSDC